MNMETGPPVLGPGKPYWFHAIAPFMGDNRYQDPQRPMRGREDDCCPSTRKRSPGAKGGYRVGQPDELELLLGFRKSYAEGSYAINAWMRSPKGSYYEPPPNDPDWNR
jgi:hypothetical protein